MQNDENKKRSLRVKDILVPAFALCLICFVVAGAMAVVNEFTHKSVEENQRIAAAATREAMFPGAAFEPVRDNCFAAYQNGALAGYVIETETQGYGGPIEIAVALDTEGRVLQLQILAADSETPGLGQKIKEEGFLAQFTGKQSVSLDDIDAVAGATISSSGVVNAVNEAIEIYSALGPLEVPKERHGPGAYSEETIDKSIGGEAQ